MTPDEYPLHDSIRGHFGRALYFEMQADPNVILLVADLGYGIFDLHQRDFPDQFINTGAAECSALGAAIGIALSGKKPVVYSITSFLLYRSFEWIRNYLNHEEIPVLLVGSGLDNDYAHDGITHQTYDAKEVLNLFPKIQQYYPDKESVAPMLRTMLTQNQPAFMCVRR